MCAALGSGIAAHNVAATVKHFALNSMENTRFQVDVSIDERALHEIYLPHFKTVLDAGVQTVMSAYNKLNGEYCGQNRHLLTDILRHEWGFDGFVHSDWVMGVYKLYGAEAGLDIENPEPLVWGEKLLAAVEAGTVAPAVIDTACRRILRVLYAVECAEDPLLDYPLSLVANPAHIALAREAAEKSAVLLANNGVLPLSPDIGRIAVLGRLAALVNTGDKGSSRVRAPHVVTPLEGLSAALGEARIVTSDESDLAAAARAAASADAVIVVAGYTATEEGEFIPGDITLGQETSLDKDLPPEVKAARRARPFAIGGDRTDLGLPADQLALIDTALASGRPVIVVIVAGSAVMVEGWHSQAAAILQTFYSGMEGGTALARLLFGQVSPAGRLPFTVASDAGDYPFFDRNATAITYDYWHGYAKLARDGRPARYPFGHGLSYSSFTTRALTARRHGDSIACSVAVTNTGTCAAEHVVLLWAQSPGGVQPFWHRKLVGFTRVSLEPGETRIAPLTVPLQALHWRDPATRQWRLEPGTWHLLTAPTAEAPADQTVQLTL
jgi:beta-glucosidase